MFGVHKCKNVFVCYDQKKKRKKEKTYSIKTPNPVISKQSEASFNRIVLKQSGVWPVTGHYGISCQNVINLTFMS